MAEGQTTTLPDLTPSGAEPPPVRPPGEPPVIPWQRRGKDLGRARAYWRTVFLVIARNGRFNDFLDGPVDYKDSQVFRSRTLAHSGAFSVLGLCLVGAGVALYWSFGNYEETAAAGEILTIAQAGLAAWTLLVFGFCATGVVSWFFCPGHYDTARQNRSIALSYYTCAPLALWPLAQTLIGVAASIVLIVIDAPTVEKSLLIGGAIVLAGHFALMIWWYQLILRAVHYVAARPGEQVFLAALLLPAAWALVELLLLIVPAGIVLLGIMYFSVT